MLCKTVMKNQIPQIKYYSSTNYGIKHFLNNAERLGEEMEEHKIAAFLLGSLPVDYNTLILSLEMRPEKDLII